MFVIDSLHPDVCWCSHAFLFKGKGDFCPCFDRGVSVLALARLSMYCFVGWGGGKGRGDITG